MAFGTGVAQALPLAVRITDHQEHLEGAASLMFAGMAAGCHSMPDTNHSSKKHCRCVL